MAKKNKEKSKGTDGQGKSEDKIIGIVIAIIIFILLIFFTVVPAFLLKFNIMGIGDKARPIVGDLPVIGNLIPESYDNPNNMTKKALSENYLKLKEEYDTAIAELEKVKKDISNLKDIKEDYEGFLEDKKRVDEKYQQFLQEQIAFEEMKDNFYQDIKENKKGDFKEYFESIEKEKAQELYEQILLEEKVDQDIQKYVTYYEKMDPEDAAALFDTMGKGKIDLIKSIMLNMKEGTVSEILAEMNTDLAARVMDEISNDLLPDVSS